MAAALDQAAVDKRAKEIETEYLSSLADLNVNSKPLINMLTILAEENLDYALVIVTAVEKHLAKVQPDVKLPILYLVDSIVKNVGKQYQSLFSQVIVGMFCGVFETVNERVREKMFSLRQTWNDVFPQSKLYTLDIKINSIDPGWPITAQLKTKSPAIHVNPMFLKNKVAEPSMDMQQQLRDKQRELLELQARKLELELLATKKRIEEQEKQLVLQTASVSKEPIPDPKRTPQPIGPSQTTSAVPPPRGRIVPPNPAMINLVKSRDPRLARQQAQLAAQMAAASTNSTPTTVVGGVQVPPQPVAFDPSGKPLSIRERLGRIPKRVDPRVKTQGSGDADRKKVSSTTTSTNSGTATPSHKSRSDSDIARKRDKKDESSVKSGKSSTARSSQFLDRKKYSPLDSSPPKSTSPVKKKSAPLEKIQSRSEKSSKQREGKSSKSGKRRSDETSKSPENTSVSSTSSSEHLMGVTNETKDVDLRLLMPEKKLRLDAPLLPPKQQAMIVTKPLTEQNKVQEEDLSVEHKTVLIKDVDLRIPPPVVMLKDVSESNAVSSSTGGLPAVKSDGDLEPNAEIDTTTLVSTVSIVPTPIDINKRRSSVGIGRLEEPIAKKSKSGKIDRLFGDQDVDLRKFSGPINTVDVSTPLPPPPPIISDAPRTMVSSGMLSESPEKQLPSVVAAPSSKAALEAVRAKIAEATKNKDRDKSVRPLQPNKPSDETFEQRRTLHQPKPMDVDLRQVPQPQLQETSYDDNSQDGMNANIKTIIAQAQEQMEKGEITSEQYNILMKQVIQLNETQKIRQAQRMEMMKRNQTGPMIINSNLGNCTGPDEALSGSPSNDDAVASNAILNSEAENKQAVAGPEVSAQKNDFRGKITPIVDAKAKFEASFANATAADLRQQRDPRRQRESRFNQQPWGNRGPIAAPPPVIATVVPIINNRPPGPMLNPWEQPPFPVMDQSQMVHPIGPRFPPIPINTSVPPATVLIPGVAKLNDSVRTINIDGVQREIRFYDDIAVIFMSWDEPKEIGFQKGSRMVVVDDRDSFELSFNECYKSITIEGKVYQMKLGSPTRELYIDNSWYECYFGDPPSNITLDGVTRVFKISGPAPQVKIGNSRNDLVAGKINMIVNAETIIPVFLDAQVQMFEIQGQIHKLQFADFLLTVIINDQPYPVEYGGLPKVFKLRGKDFYIRFTAVPKLVVPGRVYLRDMVRTPLHRDLRTPPRDQSLLPPFVSSITNVMPPITTVPPPVPGLFPAAAAMQQPPFAPTQSTTGLDYITNLMPHSSSAVNVSNNLAGYQIQSEDKPNIATPPVPNPASNATPTPLNLPLLQNINIDELYKKIVAAGIITKSTTAPTSSSASASTSAASKLDKALEEDFLEIEPVYLNKLETLKRRQPSIIAQLYTGMQCSSCGVRFPPEQTMKYSQHLDWHFRQNRRDRDSTRKAHSRKWYYNVADWIQYEEIEDLDEREKNWFETQQTEQTDFNGDGEQSGRTGPDSPSPSCPAGSNELDKRCHMCHDEFEQFYNEEIEEWHLRNAIRVDENTYHPLCYEDYKASLTLDETALNATNEEGDQSKLVDDDEVKIKQEDISGPIQAEITLDDDDDVIVLPPTADVVTEIPDDDDIETLDSLSTADGSQIPSNVMLDEGNSCNGSADSTTCQQEASSNKVVQQPRIIETRIDDDIAIQEPSIEKIDVNDLDESEEMDTSCSVEATKAKDEALVKVKEEPKDDDEIDEEDALFEDVGTIESSMIIEVAKEADTVDVEAVPSPVSALESTSQAQLKPSIDGNMELQDTPSTGVLTNKIKINITKAKTTTSSSTSTSTSSNSVSVSANSSGNTFGGSSIAVLISGGGTGMYSENSNDDLLYGNLDDMQGHTENSQNSSNQLTMVVHEDEEVDDKNKEPVATTEEEPTDISYVFKPSMKGIDFIQKPRVENGLETSGLCSIM
ncbi:uncharacterized protein LOC129776214 [Toxorhynchites rutilus septentrionalis]|uniref:uncharacterized protein LOC129776214 n=1 Tax=Toxorhynchites rutilus septentrionalis TaxID=329112 RepID=UPI0024792AD4|nr:uncharacterized protein LOC129776214 [Toxorhynchites rutilus septentrionalis]